MSEQLKRMMQDAEKWNALEAEMLKSFSVCQSNEEKYKLYLHLKGYIFDSLVYRYMKARDAETELQVIRENISYEKANNRANRDKMRFIEILNEVIDEHD